MPANRRATNEQIINAYKRTGSVWRAAKELGLVGQSVHERLVALGYPMPGRRWSQAEVDELRWLVPQMTLSEVAVRLGRPYTGVAGKVSELGIGTRHGRVRAKRKIPRGAGYDKASVERYRREIEVSGVPFGRYARAHGLGKTPLRDALARYFPDWWQEYLRQHSDLEEIECPGCGVPFIPSTKKQKCCSSRCSGRHRADRDYFGGQRRHALGMAEGECQLCLRTDVKALSAHHLLGKENDPDNEVLVALCSGCHQMVGHLGGRVFIDDPHAWERLIQFAWMRRHPEVPGVDVMVTLDALTHADVADMIESGEVQMVGEEPA